MWRYLGHRLIQGVLTFFLFITLLFFLIDAQPGDYGNVWLSDPRLTAEQRQALRQSLGLDRPVGERYLLWLQNFLRGDFGISFSNYPRPVLDVIVERAPRTITLFLTAIILSFYLGFLAGKILAWRHDTAVEYVATVGGVGLYTVFTPWFGLMMIWLFAFTLDLFPIGKFIDPTLWRKAPVEANTVFGGMLLTAFAASAVLALWLVFTSRFGPRRRTGLNWAGAGVIAASVLAAWWLSGLARYALDIAHHLILPITTLTLINFAGTMLLTRSSMLETLREDYIQAARAKGLPEAVIRDRHAARNAMLPVITAFVFSLASVMDGGVFTETIFSWPGMGLTLLEAAQVQDIPMTIGVLAFTGALALLAHLVADILYAYLDPRIRYA
jgi:peptide/nickel transport system permease protein